VSGREIEKKVTVGHARTLRRVTPILTDKSCHACHTKSLKEGEAIAALSTTLSFQSSFDQMMQDLIRTGLLQGLVILLVIAAIFSMFNRFIMNPVTAIEAFVRKLGSGDLTAAIDMRRKGQRMMLFSREKKLLIDPQDEIGELAIAFNKMAQDLQKTTASLEELNTEVHKRKKTEESLRESESRHRELFGRMSSGVALYEARNNGEDFVFKDMNPAGERLSKVKKEEILGRSVLDVFPGVRDLGLFDMLQRVWRTGISEHLPVSLYTEERMSQWVENDVYKLPSGDVVAVYNDVTERKKAEEVLKNSEALFKGVATAVPVGLGVALNRKIEWTNDNLLALVGRRKEEVWGKDARILYANEEGYLEVGNRFYAVLKAGGTAEIETVWKHKDGRILNIYLKGIVLNREDASSKIIFCVIDITERKEKEEKERKQLRALEVFYKASFGREERILELKKEVERLGHELSARNKESRDEKG
jgi:PAS domain S-box-containing protein